MTTTKYRAPYGVNKIVSGYTGNVSYIVVKRANRGRVTVHPYSVRSAAQANADTHNIGELVLGMRDEGDTRPYEDLLADATALYAELTK